MAVFLGALPAGLVPAASGQNLLANAEFDGSVGSWSGLATLEWIADDDLDGCSEGAPSSGSAEAGSVEQSGFLYSGLQPTFCLNVSPGQTVWTEIAAISPHPWSPFRGYFEESDCVGTPPAFEAERLFPASAVWELGSVSFEVPNGTQSMQIIWSAYGESGGAYSTRWDRAYVGLAERVFADGFEIGRICRWSASLGADTTPPTTPGPVSSPTHDGGPAGSPIHVSWGGSVDTGGSGLAGYRHRVSTSPDPRRCNDTIPIVYGATGVIAAVPPGAWYAFVCAQDHAGNQSEVAVGGPWIVQ